MHFQKLTFITSLIAIMMYLTSCMEVEHHSDAAAQFRAIGKGMVVKE